MPFPSPHAHAQRDAKPAEFRERELRYPAGKCSPPASGARGRAAAISVRRPGLPGGDRLAAWPYAGGEKVDAAKTKMKASTGSCRTKDNPVAERSMRMIGSFELGDEKRQHIRALLGLQKIRAIAGESLLGFIGSQSVLCRMQLL